MRIFTLFLGVFFFFQYACQTWSAPESDQPESPSKFIPIRTVVHPCFSFVRPVEKNIDQLCTYFEDFLKTSFTNQPYIKGFSPDIFRRIVEQKTAYTPYIEQMFTQHLSDSHCVDSLPDCYQEAEHSLIWEELKEEYLELSFHFLSADTVLLPVILHYETGNFLDRGLETQFMRARIGLALIHLLDGQLVWFNQKEATVLGEPTVAQLQQDLFRESFLMDYPGRLLQGN